jgi:outer membrane protein W
MHIPPTVTAKHRWTDVGVLQPDVGAGVTDTNVFNGDVPACGTVTSISSDNSVGGTLLPGADHKPNDYRSSNFEVQKISIDSLAPIMAGDTCIDAAICNNPGMISS